MQIRLAREKDIVNKQANVERINMIDRFKVLLKQGASRERDAGCPLISVNTLDQTWFDGC